MNPSLLKSLCTILMCDDPTTLTKDSRVELEIWLDDQAAKLGYQDWIDAYHAL